MEVNNNNNKEGVRRLKQRVFKELLSLEIELHNQYWSFFFF